MKILGIETSCDETAAAVVEDGRNMLSNVIASNVDLHRAYGGVVPEIAARSHLEVILPVIQEALETAKCSWGDVDAIAVTQGPGLAGSLLIGVMTAKTLAAVYDKPLYPINHVQAHIYASFITKTSLSDYALPPSPPQFPFLALVVSGGHSHLVLVKSHKSYKVIGQTRDDAVGEAYDKIAKLLGLPYPGGPSLDKLAKQGDSEALKLPIAKLENAYDFSFSGLKTAVLRAAQTMIGENYTFPSSGLSERLNKAQKANIATSFQCTAVKTLVNTLSRAADELGIDQIVVVGGVAASKELRRQISELPFSTTYTDIKLCTDNAAMIAATGYFQSSWSSPVNPHSIQIDPNLAM